MNKRRESLYRYYKQVVYLSIIGCIVTIMMSACSDSSKQSKDAQSIAQSQQQKDTPQKPLIHYSSYYGSIISLTSYDGKRRLEQCTGFYIDSTTIATIYKPFSRATRIVAKPYGSDREFTITEFRGVDRINNIILLRAESIGVAPIPLTEAPVKQKDQLVTISKKVSKSSKRIVLNGGIKEDEVILDGVKLDKISNQIFKRDNGTPIFNSEKRAVGIALQQISSYHRGYYFISSSLINKVIEEGEKRGKAMPLEALTKVSTAKGEENSKIKGVKISTSMGDIVIKLYNNMPEYRDNFIKLIEEGYYDSLLIHRVIKDFVIQGGAADTRHAEPKEEVGWRGPGYTLPANINPNQFHKRGVVGSPRLPDRKNRHKRSDGSQFYIVTGRRYNEMELNTIEEGHKVSGLNHKFTSHQRDVYKKIGGAPTLDGSYTVFGEVISGLNIADKMIKQPVDSRHRPEVDIRIKSITVIK